MDILSSKATGTLKPAQTPGATPTSDRAVPPPHATPDLPDEPLVIIQPGKSWQALNLRDLWSHRGLLYFLMWRDLKVRYKQTAIGVGWVVLQPLFMTIIFTIFLGRLARVPSDNVPYPLFVYTALIPWTFFSGSVLVTGNSLVGNAHVITKVYFPRLIIPVATVAARLVDLGVAFAILMGLMLYYRVELTLNLLALPLLVLLLTLLVLGLGMWLAALNVKYRDVGIAVPVLIQLWMFASPVVYPLSLVPQEWQAVYSLNPLVGLIEGFRASLLGTRLNWPALAISAAITLALLVYAAYSFRSREKSFADIV